MACHGLPPTFHGYSTAFHGLPLVFHWPSTALLLAPPLTFHGLHQVFVGGGTGAPNLIMSEAGLTNVFSDRAGGWSCVNMSDVLATQPDVVVIVDAAWDTALSKIDYL